MRLLFWFHALYLCWYKSLHAADMNEVSSDLDIHCGWYCQKIQVHRKVWMINDRIKRLFSVVCVLLFLIIFFIWSRGWKQIDFRIKLFVISWRNELSATSWRQKFASGVKQSLATAQAAADCLEISFLENNLGNHVDLHGWQADKSDASYEFSTREAAFGV